MSKFDKTIAGVNLLVFKDKVTARSQDGFQTLTLEDVGHLAQFCAVAWDALAGEEYKPVIITENGYVSQEFSVTEEFAENVKLERDCE